MLMKRCVWYLSHKICADAHGFHSSFSLMKSSCGWHLIGYNLHLPQGMFLTIIFKRTAHQNLSKTCSYMRQFHSKNKYSQTSLWRPHRRRLSGLKQQVSSQYRRCDTDLTCQSKPGWLSTLIKTWSDQPNIIFSMVALHSKVNCKKNKKKKLKHTQHQDSDANYPRLHYQGVKIPYKTPPKVLKPHPSNQNMWPLWPFFMWIGSKLTLEKCWGGLFASDEQGVCCIYKHTQTDDFINNNDDKNNNSSSSNK